ncbi:MAG: TonB-dependent receptor [Acidobacteriia bacterium]|nr:TonB-dependent receptor [Terriglobia bacterium]
MERFRLHLLVGLLFSAMIAQAQIFGTVRGTVLDPQKLPIPGATVTLKARGSAWSVEATTNDAGEFSVPTVPAGSYTIEIDHMGFKTMSELLNLSIGSAPALIFFMELGSVKTDLEVTAALEITNPEASSPPVSISEQDILHTPGADRTSSMNFVTDYVPGSYMLHDHLHMRGGHEVTWLVDGVPIPNTNISTNVGRQMDPKDMQSVEVSRGGYSARYGDRTYGMVNIVTRSGFEFDREGELKVGFGSLNQTNDQLSLGGHSTKMAYYVSLTGSRTDLGLEPPTTYVLHNNGSALGGFTSLTYNAGPNDQLRWNASLRNDRYQIPNTYAEQAEGFRDIDSERDSFVNFSWVHTVNAYTLLTVSPFYHYNNSQYNGGLGDPLITTANRVSHYGGGQVTLGVVEGQHNFNAGLYGFHQSDDSLFRLEQTGVNPLTASEHIQPSGDVATVFLDEQYKPWRWITLNAGLRMTHYAGQVNENAANPRMGAALEIPRLKWVARAYYGYYYQPPPLSTISGPLLSFAVAEGFNFLPLHGERDHQKEVGLTIPYRGWVADFAHFQTDASNFADHDVLGNSNITLPLSIAYVRVRGWEGTLRSPQVWRRVRFHLAYSNQVVKGAGSITGGLINFVPPAQGFFYIDHDQRDTLSTGGEATLPWRTWMSTNINYGSGFLDLNGPQHLPPHTTADFSLGKSWREDWTFGFTVLNIANSRYLLGRDSAFAGTHYNDPRQVMGQVTYRFHY